MKNKVGIITMHKVLNFGSALQTFALQKTIERLGFSTEIIDYKFPNEFQEVHRRKKTIWKKITDGRFLYKLNYYFALKTWLSWKDQEQKFNQFYSRFYTLSKNYPNYDLLKSKPPYYDFLCIGSDQVWNYNHTAGDPAFLGSFIDDSTIKFSYASSFSNSQIEERDYENFKEELPKFKAIGVREKSGVNLVRQLTGRDAQMVCDPVFLLNKDEYDKMALSSEIKINEKYILAYVLEYNFNPHPIIDELIKKLYEATGYKVIYLLCGGIPEHKIGNSCTITNAGPIEFLYLISHAEVVITSSFHGAALSAILQKNLYGIIDSKSMDDRLGNLFTNLEIANRLYSNSNTLDKFTVDALNYKKIESTIKEIQSNSINFLKSTLQTTENK